MSFPVLSLILTAAFLHAWWNFLVKKAGGGVTYIWLVYGMSIVIYSPMVVWQLATGAIQYSPTLVVFSLLSGMVHLAYFYLLQKGYQSADFSVVYPLARGSGPLLSSLLGVTLLHERYSFLTAAGLLSIVTGVLVITRFNLRFFRDAKLKTGVFYGLATGLFIAAYTIIDAIAVKRHQISPTVITLATNLVGLLALAPVCLRHRDRLSLSTRKHMGSVVAVAAVSPLAYILVLVALRYAPLTAVAPARESSILFGAFLGASVLKEGEGLRRMAASGFILTGIVCLAIA